MLPLKSTDCGMYIPLSDDKHRKVRDSSKKCTGNLRQRQNAVQDKIQSENFFRWSEFFFFQSEFCLGLNLSRTEFCFGLHTAVVFRMQSFNCTVDLSGCIP